MTKLDNIRVARNNRTHAGSREAKREIAAAHLAGREISDPVAMTIASWWQSGGPIGRHFAQLASTGEVDAQDILDAIAAEYPEAKRQDCALELDMLATWALNHESRGE